MSQFPIVLDISESSLQVIVTNSICVVHINHVVLAFHSDLVLVWEVKYFLKADFL